MSARGLLALGDLCPVIVSYARTPIGALRRAFNGALSSLSAPKLGAVAIEAACAKVGVGAADIDEVLFGNVVSAGIGQAPATQAVIYAGLGEEIPSTTINKVCASGMKALMLGAQSIALGQRECMVVGGMESMSNIPHYLPGARGGIRLGDSKIVDGAVFDGLWDPYGDQHMGMCAEKCAADYGISRADQDAYAEESYARARAAAAVHAKEIAPVTIKTRKGETVVAADEEPAKDTSRLTSLRSAFKKEGTVTAGNASKLNDGAAALVIMSRGKARALGLEPLAAVAGFGDAQRAPVDFTVAPSLAVPKALAAAGMGAGDVSYHEVNEAFSVVALANAQILGLDLATVNPRGGAVSLGHPIGCSGARIVGALAMGLAEDGLAAGTASICNGGGGASAVVLERI